MKTEYGQLRNSDDYILLDPILDIKNEKIVSDLTSDVNNDSHSYEIGQKVQHTIEYRLNRKRVKRKFQVLQNFYSRNECLCEKLRESYFFYQAAIHYRCLLNNIYICLTFHCHHHL